LNQLIRSFDPNYDDLQCARAAKLVPEPDPRQLSLIP
jgi:hypothetical protein